MKRWCWTLFLFACAPERATPTLRVSIRNIPPSLTELVAVITAGDQENERRWQGAALGAIHDGASELTIALGSSELIPLAIHVSALDGACLIAQGEASCDRLQGCAPTIELSALEGCPGSDAGAPPDLSCVEAGCDGR